MNLPQPVALTPEDQLEHLVEQRRGYDAHACQLNIFETHRKAADFHLRFSGFTITSMLRGKKVMHLEGRESFDYLPGQSVMARPDTLMRIDFPDAEAQNPTQCTALVLEPAYLEHQLAYLNERTARPVEAGEWRIDPDRILLNNNRELADLSDKVIALFASESTLKEVQLDIAVKELLLCIVRLQHMEQIATEQYATSRAFSAVMRFIRENLTTDLKLDHLCKMAGMSKSAFYTSFVNEFGITPRQLIIRERLRTARELLLREGLNIKEACYAAGFSDPNYFIRLFKKNEGITPGALVKRQQG